MVTCLIGLVEFCINVGSMTNGRRVDKSSTYFMLSTPLTVKIYI